jgi:hypothetical protein
VEFNASLGTVALAPVGYQEILGENTQNRFAYARIKKIGAGDHPQTIEVEGIAHSQSATHIFIVAEGKAVPIQEAFTFTVPVEWNGNIPRTRFPGQDNIDVIFLAADGQFVDIQCGIITRKGLFYMTAQQVWKGNVVRTFAKGTREKAWMYAPTAAAHAFPGSDYGSLWTKMGEQVLSQALGASASEQKSRVTVPKWDPPALSSQSNADGYREAAVLFFNLVTGTGHLQDASGKKWFVHFNNILGVPDGKIPVLLPMTKILFRGGDAPTEKGLMPKVRSVKLVA